MKKSALRQRKMEKTSKCKEGYSMQPKKDSEGNVMKDPSGAVIKSCQKDTTSKYTGTDRSSGKKVPPSGEK